MQQQVGHQYCQCGHSKGTHASGKSLCQLKGCGCGKFDHDFTMTAEEHEQAESARKNHVWMLVGGSWI